jgi:hypothetical protein
MLPPSEEELKEMSAWRPSGVKGPVPKRVEKVNWLPIRPPKTPERFKNPQIITFGNEIMARIKADMKKDLYDPWAKRHEWRNHIYFQSGWNRVRLAMPGFLWGTSAFILFVAADKLDILPRRNPPPAHH